MADAKPELPANPEQTAPHVPEPASTVRTAIPAPAGAAPVEVTTSSTPGRFRLGAEIARGGMGVVYRAEDTAFGREVAVKLLNPRLVGTTAADRFFDEAKITGRLEHPSIPPVYDLGTLSDGTPFLAMQLIKGTDANTLDARLRERDSPAENLEYLADVFEKICLAVAFAHSRGVIHRDLKPGNVMTGAFGEVLVMDWGLAKETRRRDPAAISGDRPPVGLAGGSAGPAGTDMGPVPSFVEPEGRTQLGAVMGTPAFMPPEQARGETDRVDERADVFALGGILCAILTGKPPYTKWNSRELLRDAAEGNLDDALLRLDQAADRSAVARRLRPVARRCLRADPAGRYAHAGEVAAAVNASKESGEGARRKEELGRAVAEVDRRREQAVRLNRWLAFLGAGGLALGVLIAVVVWTVARANTTSADRKTEEMKAERDRASIAAREARETLAERDRTAATQELARTRARRLAAEKALPELVRAAGRDLETGRFAPAAGPDLADYRAWRLDTLRSTADDLAPVDAAFAWVVRMALHRAAGDENAAAGDWGEAVKRYQAVAPHHTEVELAVALVARFRPPTAPVPGQVAEVLKPVPPLAWLVRPPRLGALDRLVLERVAVVLKPAAAHAEVPANLRKRAAAALAVVEKASQK